MGEPLLNYEAVEKAIEIMTTEGLISWLNIKKSLFRQLALYQLLNKWLIPV